MNYRDYNESGTSLCMVVSGLIFGTTHGPSSHPESDPG